MTTLTVAASYVGRAANAPAATIVVPMKDLSIVSVEKVLKPARAAAMELDPALGAKTMAMVVESDGLALAFFQGLPEGEIDSSVATCLNSAAVAAAVARHVLHELQDGVVTVHIAGQTWHLEEVPA